MQGTARPRWCRAEAEGESIMAVPAVCPLSCGAVHDYAFPGGWHAQDVLLKGYFQGKRDAERHMQATFPTGM